MGAPTKDDGALPCPAQLGTSNVSCTMVAPIRSGPRIAPK
jgi:hypothetical protein